jgi:hypothetical protein
MAVYQRKDKPIKNDKLDRECLFMACHHCAVSCQIVKERQTRAANEKVLQ